MHQTCAHCVLRILSIGPLVTTLVACFSLNHVSADIGGTTVEIPMSVLTVPLVILVLLPALVALLL